MKNLINKLFRLTFVLAISLSASGFASAQQWYSLGLTSVGDNSLVDVDRLQFDGNTASFWLRTYFKEPKWANDLSSGIGGFLAGAFKSKIYQSLELYEIDCDRMNGVILSRSRLSEAGDVIDSRTITKARGESGDPVQFPPGSMGARAVNFVCKRGRELAKGANDAQMIHSSVKSANWRQVTQDQSARHFISDDLISNGTGDLSGLQFFYEKISFDKPINFGQIVVSELYQAHALKCATRETTTLGDVAYAPNGALLYRSEFLDPESQVFGTGTKGKIVTDEVCTTVAKLTSAEKLAAPEATSIEKSTATWTRTGTAWLTPSGYFVTAYHVIADTNSLFLYGADKQPFRARIIAADEKNDIVLLWADLKGKSVRPIPFAKGASAIGSRVFTIGFPHSDLLGISPKVTSGEVSGTLPLDPTKVLISVPVQSGNSGGPLINMNGEAVGLVIQKLSATKVFKVTGDLTENTNFALRVKYVDALIDDQPKIETDVGFPKVVGNQLEDWVAAYKDSVFFVVGTNAPLGK